MADTATIFNVRKFSTDDGPGLRSAVFFKGCPMHCPWCPNPEAQKHRPEIVWHRRRCLGDRGCVEVCPEQAIADTGAGLTVDLDRCTACDRCAAFCPSGAIEVYGRTIDADELYDLLARDALFYESSGGGVTLTGGEPLDQPGPVFRLLDRLQDAGIHSALDTSGAVSVELLREALGKTDLVLFDLKTADPEKHLAYTGVPFARVEAAAHCIEGSGLPVWIRTPIVPGLTDDEAQISAVGRFVAETFSHCERHALLALSKHCSAKYTRMERPFPLSHPAVLEPERIERLCDVLRDAGSENVHWSGPLQVA